MIWVGEDMLGIGYDKSGIGVGRLCYVRSGV